MTRPVMDVGHACMKKKLCLVTRRVRASKDALRRADNEQPLLPGVRSFQNAA